ncbi:hypothetical protein JRQ81_010886 [Phrynocephalus forsythii]|uniref:Uncharacterized protein n=1 Tax=Phrynocephalus forsythii TaxID=171643 RepID=A0A9Q0Y1H9_9SAUR|nr:hypothetical protein JRQ81_010886 [Phrynocephalus forsythii]
MKTLTVVFLFAVLCMERGEMVCVSNRVLSIRERLVGPLKWESGSFRKSQSVLLRCHSGESRTRHLRTASLLRYCTCQNETSPSASLFTPECLESERHCMAVYNRTSDRKLSTSKWSAQKCPEIKETGIKVVRCEDNYCNRIGPSSRSPSCATLIMVTLALSMVTLAASMVTLATFYILQINP